MMRSASLAIAFSVLRALSPGAKSQERVREDVAAIGSPLGTTAP